MLGLRKLKMVQHPRTVRSTIAHAGDMLHPNHNRYLTIEPSITFRSKFSCTLSGASRQHRAMTVAARSKQSQVTHNLTLSSDLLVACIVQYSAFSSNRAPLEYLLSTLERWNELPTDEKKSEALHICGLLAANIDGNNKLSDAELATLAKLLLRHIDAPIKTVLSSESHKKQLEETSIVLRTRLATLDHSALSKGDISNLIELFSDGESRAVAKSSRVATNSDDLIFGDNHLNLYSVLAYCPQGQKWSDLSSETRRLILQAIKATVDARRKTATIGTAAAADTIQVLADLTKLRCSFHYDLQIDGYSIGPDILSLIRSGYFTEQLVSSPTRDHRRVAGRLCTVIDSLGTCNCSWDKLSAESQSDLLQIIEWGLMDCNYCLVSLRNNNLGMNELPYRLDAILRGLSAIKIPLPHHLLHRLFDGIVQYLHALKDLEGPMAAHHAEPNANRKPYATGMTSEITNTKSPSSLELLLPEDVLKLLADIRYRSLHNSSTAGKQEAEDDYYYWSHPELYPAVLDYLSFAHESKGFDHRRAISMLKQLHALGISLKPEDAIFRVIRASLGTYCNRATGPFEDVTKGNILAALALHPKLSINTINDLLTQPKPTPAAVNVRPLPVTRKDSLPLPKLPVVYVDQSVRAKYNFAQIKERAADLRTTFIESSRLSVLHADQANWKPTMSTSDVVLSIVEIQSICDGIAAKLPPEHRPPFQLNREHPSATDLLSWLTSLPSTGSFHEGFSAYNRNILADLIYHIRHDMYEGSRSTVPSLLCVVKGLARSKCRWRLLSSAEAQASIVGVIEYGLGDLIVSNAPTRASSLQQLLESLDAIEPVLPSQLLCRLLIVLDVHIQHLLSARSISSEDNAQLRAILSSVLSICRRAHEASPPTSTSLSEYLAQLHPGFGSLQASFSEYIAQVAQHNLLMWSETDKQDYEIFFLKSVEVTSIADNLSLEIKTAVPPAPSPTTTAYPSPSIQPVDHVWNETNESKMPVASTPLSKLEIRRYCETFNNRQPTNSKFTGQIRHASMGELLTWLSSLLRKTFHYNFNHQGRNVNEDLIYHIMHDMYQASGSSVPSLLCVVKGLARSKCRWRLLSSAEAQASIVGVIEYGLGDLIVSNAPTRASSLQQLLESLDAIEPVLPSQLLCRLLIVLDVHIQHLLSARSISSEDNAQLRAILSSVLSICRRAHEASPPTSTSLSEYLAQLHPGFGSLQASFSEYIAQVAKHKVPLLAEVVDCADQLGLRNVRMNKSPIIPRTLSSKESVIEVATSHSQQFPADSLGSNGELLSGKSWSELSSDQQIQLIQTANAEVKNEFNPSAEITYISPSGAIDMLTRFGASGYCFHEDIIRNEVVLDIDSIVQAALLKDDGLDCSRLTMLCQGLLRCGFHWNLLSLHSKTAIEKAVVETLMRDLSADKNDLANLASSELLVAVADLKIALTDVHKCQVIVTQAIAALGDHQVEKVIHSLLVITRRSLGYIASDIMNGPAQKMQEHILSLFKRHQDQQASKSNLS